MDDRAHLAAALVASFSRDLHAVLDDGERSGEVDLALPAGALDDVPRALGAFCRELDLRLVQLQPLEARGWRAVLAWSDDVGRPRFLGAELHGDYYRGGVLFLRGAELLELAPGVRFVHALVRFLWRDEPLRDWEAEALNAEREAAPRAALERAARLFPRARDWRLISQAMRSGNWMHVAAQRSRLRAAARLARRRYRLRGALTHMAQALRGTLQPARASIAFVGDDDARREAVRQTVVRDLAPAFPGGPATLAYRSVDEHWGVDLRIVLGDAAHASRCRNAVYIDVAQPLAAVIAAAERAILSWLESRIERRYPEALVGRNPAAARFLQWAVRSRLPLVGRAAQVLLNCDLECELQAPVLMPHPYGIVIERGTRIGNRVTVFQQASLMADASGAPHIEENVRIGPGARIVGAVRIGRYAVIGPNAVVTTDVASHCTVEAGSVSPPPDEARVRSVVNS